MWSGHVNTYGLYLVLEMVRVGLSVHLADVVPDDEPDPRQQDVELDGEGVEVRDGLHVVHGQDGRRSALAVARVAVVRADGDVWKRNEIQLAGFKQYGHHTEDTAYTDRRKL